MTERVASALGGALRERLLDRVRLMQRVQALETYPEGGERQAVSRRDAEAVLRQALRALGNRECYEMAGRLLAGEAVTGGGLEEWTGLQELAQAGLVAWDVGSGRVEVTPLLRELDAVLAGAVQEAAGP
jgi:hypothetical protein